MCFDLPPLGECAYGRCVSGECVCDPGVIQSVELLFRPVPPNSTVICDYYVDGAIGSTIFVLVLGIIVFFFQVKAIRKFNQFKRQVPILLGYISLVVALSIRLARPLEPLWGIDFAFTFCLVSHLMLSSFQISVFLNRYIVYLDKTLIMRRGHKSMVTISLVITYIDVILIFTGSALWIAPVFVESLEVSHQLTLAGCGLWAAACFFFTFANSYLLSRYIVDVESLIWSSNDKTGAQKRDFILRCERQLPRMKVVRMVNCTGTFLFGVSLITTMFLEGWLKQLNFIFYIVVILYQISNFCVLRAFAS